MIEAAFICMAMAVYYEARSEPEEGQRQVVHVIQNRVEHGAWPNDACSVVKQPSAFSFYWDGKPEKMSDGKAWAAAQKAVVDAMDAPYENLGATHYHATYVSPPWSKSNKVKALDRIGSHIFYYEER